MAEKKETKKIKEEPKKEKESKSHFAIVNARGLPISTKQSVEIARFIKGKKLKKAKFLLEQVLDKKIAVPYLRYNRDTPHKKGKIAAGRYPLKATQNFMVVLNSLEANAENKGLNAEQLVVSEIMVNKDSNQWHAGRLRRRRMKRTSLIIKAVEIEK